MPRPTSTTGSELFIVDNCDNDWKVLRYLHDWCQLSKAIDVATGYFEIGGLLARKDEWQKVQPTNGKRPVRPAADHGCTTFSTCINRKHDHYIHGTPRK